MDNRLFDELRFEMRRSRLPLMRLARRSGVCHITLYRWMDGTVRSPRLDTALKVAAALGLTLDMTEGRAKLVPTKPREPAPPRSPRQPILRHWRELSPLYRWQ